MALTHIVRLFSAVAIAAGLTLSVSPATVQAEEGDCQLSPKAEQSFTKMDQDKSGAASKDEFKATYPNMTEEAFNVIDTDHDGSVTKKEWCSFTKGHAMQGGGNQGAASGMKPMMMPPSGESKCPVAGNGMPMMMPPSDKK